MTKDIYVLIAATVMGMVMMTGCSASAQSVQAASEATVEEKQDVPADWMEKGYRGDHGGKGGKGHSGKEKGNRGDREFREDFDDADYGRGTGRMSGVITEIDGSNITLTRIDRSNRKRKNKNSETTAAETTAEQTSTAATGESMTITVTDDTLIVRLTDRTESKADLTDLKVGTMIRIEGEDMTKVTKVQIIDANNAAADEAAAAENSDEAAGEAAAN